MKEQEKEEEEEGERKMKEAGKMKADGKKERGIVQSCAKWKVQRRDHERSPQKIQRLFFFSFLFLFFFFDSKSSSRNNP